MAAHGGQHHHQPFMRKPIQTAYHLVDGSNWASVQNHGLMSARRLMEVCGGTECDASRHHRPASRRLVSTAS